MNLLFSHHRSVFPLICPVLSWGSLVTVGSGASWVGELLTGSARLKWHSFLFRPRANAHVQRAVHSSIVRGLLHAPTTTTTLLNSSVGVPCS